MVWKIPDNNYEGKGFMATIIILGVVDLICVGVRFYSRYLQRNYPALNDYLLLAAFAMTIGVMVISWATYSHGYGLDISEFNYEDVVMSSKLFAPTDIIWNASTTLIRISMILFYRQIFKVVSYFNIASVILLILNIMSFVAVFITSLSICRPITYSFLRVGTGYCGSLQAFETYMAVAALVLDASVVCLPMPCLWKLQISSARKLGLTALMGIGILSITLLTYTTPEKWIFSICCLTLFRLIVSYVYMPENIAKQYAIVMFVTALEPLLGIIVACLPFFPRWFKHLRGSNIISGSGNGSKLNSEQTDKSQARRQPNTAPFIDNNVPHRPWPENEHHWKISSNKKRYPNNESQESLGRLVQDGSNIYVLQDFHVVQQERDGQSV